MSVNPLHFILQDVLFFFSESSYPIHARVDYMGETDNFLESVETLSFVGQSHAVHRVLVGPEGPGVYLVNDLYFGSLRKSLHLCE